MTDWLTDYGLFLAKALTLLAVVGLIIALVARVRGEPGERVRLRIEDLNERYLQRRRRLRLASTARGLRKGQLKAFRRADKDEKRQAKGQASVRPCVWVLDFHGDLRASNTPRLAEEISALLGVVKEGDEVVIRLESAGGLVHSYGLAAAQLDRLRGAGVNSTVCVDKVAASGGYLMACCADRLRVAPFAVLGSIGVVAQLPNIHRLLKRHDVDVEVLTAGRYKRTLTVFGENTEEGREKFIDDLENTHELFKRYVAERRADLDIDAVSTGEIWYGSDAVQRGLADSLGTSEAYLLERMNDARVLAVRLETRRGLSERLGLAIAKGAERGVERAIEVADASRWLRK
ncbi:protease SohB [Litchfieldella qijiaojingensis]|uniref:Protease SohB n=1 Tax=Litchfieldella qijiaojingensis TaxID=980347 RepID=A0ABQ2YBU3_9GAMM|nr:protease SohB [Halomonas qijiaojingensis]GGX78548.1 protease SohB [Halomonas qijiaojingensis]